MSDKLEIKFKNGSVISCVPYVERKIFRGAYSERLLLINHEKEKGILPIGKGANKKEDLTD